MNLVTWHYWSAHRTLPSTGSIIPVQLMASLDMLRGTRVLGCMATSGMDWQYNPSTVDGITGHVEGNQGTGLHGHQ